MKAAVADHLHDAAVWPRQPQSQRHAAAEAEPAAREPDIALWLGPLHVLLQDRPVTDSLIEHDVVLRNFPAERRQHEGGIERARNTLVGAGRGALLRRCSPGAFPARDAIGDPAAIFLVCAGFDDVAYL